MAYDIFVENIDAARVMYSIYYGPPQGAPFIDFDAYHRRFQEAVLQVLGEGIRDGEFRRVNPHDAMWAVIGALNVAMEVGAVPPAAESRAGRRPARPRARSRRDRHGPERHGEKGRKR